MAYKPDRLHIALGILLALGIAFRAVRERAPKPSANAALNAQIDLVSKNREARGKEAKTRAKGPRAAAKAATGKASAPTPPAGPRSETTPIGARDPSSIHVASATRVQPARPAGAKTRSSPINVDLASAATIESLPRIGPALARRIVEDRKVNGNFGSLDGLMRVKGVGPSLLAAIAPHVTFATSGRPSSVAAIPPAGAKKAAGGKGRRRAPSGAGQ